MQPNNTPEKWRPVVGYEGHYEVSDQGRVRSLRRDVPSRWGGTRKWGGKTLRGTVTNGGYVAVALSLNRKVKVRSVHRMVAEAFIGPIPDGMYVLHYNDVGTDNRLENLRIGTVSENGHDAVRNGRNPHASKTHCIRGHALSGPNLLPGPNGGRRCRSCGRAYSYVYKHSEFEPMFQQIADEKYARLMGEAA